MANDGHTIKLFLFNQPRLDVGGESQTISNRKAIALLVYLAINSGAHSRDHLGALLWPEYNQTRARANLRRTLWVLNQTPLADLIEAEQESIQLRTADSFWVDVHQFRESISRWQKQDKGMVSAEGTARLVAATDLYQGDFLHDFYLADSNEFEEWATVQREELRRQVLEAFNTLMIHYLDHGENDTTQTIAWKALAIDNLRESAYRSLMIALTRSGQRVAALAQYENLRRLLDDELGVDPSAETTAVYEQIRADTLPGIPKLPAEESSLTRLEILEINEMPVFLLTDIENSTPLWDRHRQAMLGALQQHNDILKEKIDSYGGRIEELRGDGVLAVFDAGRPLDAALEIQKAFGRVDWGEIGELKIRVGLHGVPGDWEGYDFFRTEDEVTGPALNYAARVMDAGWGGQILVSGSVKGAYPLPEGASWRDFGEHELKGCEEPLHIFGLLHPDFPHQNFGPLRTLTTEKETDTIASESALVPVSPYRGLYAFREEDAPYFFGRETFTEMLLESVRERSMVAVVGPSGSGKSSVVHAGLLAQLRRQGKWLITSFRPGHRPFHALAATLIPYLEPSLSKTDQLVETNKLAEALVERKIALIDIVQSILEGQPPGTRMPLVGDQFEELYTLVPELELRNQFMDTLTEAVFDQQYRPAPIFSFVLTLRADFLGQALAYRPFADAIQESDVKLGPMTRSELGRAIVNPAQKLDVSFETGLVPRILDDVGDEPGNLPLLEFALAMLWERQEGALLTHQAYETIDRVDGALARHADSVFEELDAEDQAAARRVFVQVVRPGEGTEDTRRLATRTELGEASWGLVQRLADARLLVTGRDSIGNETVEVVHEALIRGWSRLRAWMNADREFRVWQERLRALIRGWDASDRDEGGLLRGVPLAAAEGWFEERENDLSEGEIEFIQASVDQRRQREEAKQEQQERELTLERAALRRLRIIVTVLVAASIMGITLTVAIFNQSRIAQQRADEIQTLALVRAAEDAYETLFDPELALALALEANAGENPIPEAVETLRRVAFAPGVRAVIDAHENIVNAVAYDPDHNLLASFGGIPTAEGGENQDYSIAIWNPDSRELIHRLEGHTDAVTDIDISPDGSQLISTGADGKIIIWDLQTGVETHTYQSELPFGRFVRFLDSSPVGAQNQTALVVSRLRNEGITDIFDPFFIGDTAINLLEIESGEALYHLEPDHDGQFIKQIDFNIDQGLIAGEINELVGTDISAPYSGSSAIVLWDLTTGEEITRLDTQKPGLWVNNLRIDPDGDRILITLDGQPGGMFAATLINWDINSGNTIPQDFDMPIWIDRFSPDGETAYLGSPEGFIEMDPQNTEIVHQFPDNVNYLDFSEDDSRMLSFNPMVLWDPVSREKLIRFESQDDIQMGILLPDGRSAITAHGSGTIRFWDLNSGFAGRSAAEKRILTGHEDRVTEAKFSPDGKTAVSAGGVIEPGLETHSDNSVIVWDVDTGEILQRLDGHKATVWSLDFSPDGQRIASGSQDESVILWDRETGEIIHQWNGLGETVMDLVFIPDGSGILAGIGTPYGNFAVEGALYLLDTDSGDITHKFLNYGDDPTVPIEPFSHVWAVAISLDGTQALTGYSNDPTIDLWDLESGEIVRSFSTDLIFEEDAVEGLAFTPNGQSFVSNSFSGKVLLWNIQTSKVILQYRTPPFSNGHRIAISPNGDFLIGSFGPAAVAAEEATKAILMWDLETGLELQRFEGHTNWVRGVDFSPDGSQIISASGDGTVRLWNFIGADLLEWIVENRYVRAVTIEERARYRLVDPVP